MGIGQLFKKREEPQEEENLKEMFENIKSQEIPHKTGKKSHKLYLCIKVWMWFYQ